MPISEAIKQKVKEDMLEWAMIQYYSTESKFDNVESKKLVIQKVTEKLDHDQRQLQPANQINDEVHYVQRVQNLVKQVLGRVHESITLQPQRVNDLGTQSNMQKSQYITSQIKDNLGQERPQVTQYSQIDQGNTIQGVDAFQSAQQVNRQRIFPQAALSQQIQQRPDLIQQNIQLRISQDGKHPQVIDPVQQLNITQINNKNMINYDQQQLAGDQGLAVSDMYCQNMQDDIPQRTGSQILRYMQPQLMDDPIHKQEPFPEFYQPKQRQDLAVENIQNGLGRQQNMNHPLYQRSLFERQNRQYSQQTRGQSLKGIEDTAGLQDKVNSKFYPINTIQSASAKDVCVVRHSSSDQGAYKAGLSKQGGVQPDFRGTQGFSQTSKLEHFQQNPIQQNLPQGSFQYNGNIPKDQAQSIQLTRQRAMEVTKIENQQVNQLQKQHFQQMQNERQVYDINSGKVVYQSQIQFGMQDNQGQVQTNQGTVSQYNKGHVDNIYPLGAVDYSNMQNNPQYSQPKQQIQQERLVRFWNLHRELKDVGKAYLECQLERRSQIYENTMNAGISMDSDRYIAQLEKINSILDYDQKTSRPNLDVDLTLLEKLALYFETTQNRNIQVQRLEAYNANNKMLTARGGVSQDAILFPYAQELAKKSFEALSEKVSSGLLTKDQAIRIHQEEQFKIQQMCSQRQQTTVPKDVVVIQQQQQYANIQNPNMPNPNIPNLNMANPNSIVTNPNMQNPTLANSNMQNSNMQNFNYEKTQVQQSGISNAYLNEVKNQQMIKTKSLGEQPMREGDFLGGGMQLHKSVIDSNPIQIYQGNMHNGQYRNTDSQNSSNTLEQLRALNSPYGPILYPEAVYKSQQIPNQNQCVQQQLHFQQHAQMQRGFTGNDPLNKQQMQSNLCQQIQTSQNGNQKRVIEFQNQMDNMQARVNEQALQDGSRVRHKFQVNEIQNQHLFNGMYNRNQAYDDRYITANNVYHQQDCLDNKDFMNYPIRTQNLGFQSNTAQMQGQQQKNMMNNFNEGEMQFAQSVQQQQQQLQHQQVMQVHQQQMQQQQQLQMQQQQQFQIQGYNMHQGQEQSRMQQPVTSQWHIQQDIMNQKLRQSQEANYNQDGNAQLMGSTPNYHKLMPNNQNIYNMGNGNVDSYNLRLQNMGNKQQVSISNNNAPLQEKYSMPPQQMLQLQWRESSQMQDQAQQPQVQDPRSLLSRQVNKNDSAVNNVDVAKNMDTKKSEQYEGLEINHKAFEVSVTQSRNSNPNQQNTLSPNQKDGREQQSGIGENVFNIDKRNSVQNFNSVKHEGKRVESQKDKDTATANSIQSLKGKDKGRNTLKNAHKEGISQEGSPQKVANNRKGGAKRGRLIHKNTRADNKANDSVTTNKQANSRKRNNAQSAAVCNVQGTPKHRRVTKKQNTAIIDTKCNNQASGFIVEDSVVQQSPSVKIESTRRKRKLESCSLEFQKEDLKVQVCEADEVGTEAGRPSKVQKVQKKNIQGNPISESILQLPNEDLVVGVFSNQQDLGEEAIGKDFDFFKDFFEDDALDENVDKDQMAVAEIIVEANNKAFN